MRNQIATSSESSLNGRFGGGRETQGEWKETT